MDSELATAENEIELLRQFVAFVNLWCHRETKISDSERLSMIKFHPTAQAALKKSTLAQPGNSVATDEGSKEWVIGLRAAEQQRIVDAALHWMVERSPKDPAEKELYVAMARAFPVFGKETCECGDINGCDECPTSAQVEQALASLEKELGPLYVVRMRGGVAHVWGGRDTLCRMWSTGGLNSRSYGFTHDKGERKICQMCAARADDRR